MKKIIRRLTAFALCAILVMAMPLASAQELFTPEGVLLTVQIAVTLAERHAQCSAGYARDEHAGRHRLLGGREHAQRRPDCRCWPPLSFSLTSETGELYAAAAAFGQSALRARLTRAWIFVNDMIPGGSLTILPAESAAPMDGEEADARAVAVWL